MTLAEGESRIVSSRDCFDTYVAIVYHSKVLCGEP